MPGLCETVFNDTHLCGHLFCKDGFLSHLSKSEIIPDTKSYELLEKLECKCRMFSTYLKKKRIFYCRVLVPKASLFICGDLCCVSEASHIKHLKSVIFCKLKGQS